jgi:hypothetical protein
LRDSDWAVKAPASCFQGELLQAEQQQRSGLSLVTSPDHKCPTLMHSGRLTFPWTLCRLSGGVAGSNGGTTIRKPYSRKVTPRGSDSRTVTARRDPIVWDSMFIEVKSGRPIALDITPFAFTWFLSLICLNVSFFPSIFCLLFLFLCQSDSPMPHHVKFDQLTSKSLRCGAVHFSAFREIPSQLASIQSIP